MGADRVRAMGPCRAMGMRKAMRHGSHGREGAERAYTVQEHGAIGPWISGHVTYGTMNPGAWVHRRHGGSHGRGGRSGREERSGLRGVERAAIQSQLIGSRGMGPWDHGPTGPWGQEPWVHGADRVETTQHHGSIGMGWEPWAGWAGRAERTSHTLRPCVS